MPLFMYVSGFVYKKYQKPVKYKDFITKKFRRLIIPYFLVSILIICIKLMSEKGMYVENPVSFSSFYEMFYLPSAGVFLWFVYVLFMIFLIVPVFNTEKKINTLLIISLVLLLLPVEFTDLFCLSQFKAHFFFFVLGCFTSQYENIRDKVNSIPLFVILLIFALFYLPVALKMFTLSYFSNLFLLLILAILGIIFIIKISRTLDSKTISVKNFFIRLSVYSYTIYLFHTTFQGFGKAIFSKIPLEGYIGEGLYFLVLITIINALGIVGPIILYKLDSKFKLTRYL